MELWMTLRTLEGALIIKIYSDVSAKLVIKRSDTLLTQSLLTLSILELKGQLRLKLKENCEKCAAEAFTYDSTLQRT